MNCPHCDKDTPATLPYCQMCGLSVDLTFEKVQESFTEEATAREVHDSDERCRAWLLGTATALIIVLCARWLLVPVPPTPPVLPPYIVSEPADVANASPVGGMEIVVPGVEVPR